MYICFLSLSVSIQVSDAYVKVLSIIVFFSRSFSFDPILPLNLHEGGFRHWGDTAFGVSSIFMNIVPVSKFFFQSNVHLCNELADLKRDTEYHAQLSARILFCTCMQFWCVSEFFFLHLHVILVSATILLCTADRLFCLWTAHGPVRLQQFCFILYCRMSFIFGQEWNRIVNGLEPFQSWWT